MIFGFHLLKVDEKIVALGIVFAEVKFHASIIARLKACLFSFLVVVEVFIKVGQLFMRKTTRCHAVLKYNASCRFKIKALIIEVPSERHDHIKLHVVFGT